MCAFLEISTDRMRIVGGGSRRMLADTITVEAVKNLIFLNFYFIGNSRR